MNSLTSLNIYSANISRHETCFRKIFKKELPTTKSLFTTFLQAIFQFSNTNYLEIPFEIKRIILETILDLKYKDLNAKILYIATGIYKNLLKTKCHRSISLDASDVLNNKKNIYPHINVTSTSTFYFILKRNSDRLARLEKCLFPLHTRAAITYVEDVITNALKKQQMYRILMANLPFSEIAKEIPIPLY